MRQWVIIGIIVAILIASYFWNRSREIQPGETLPTPEEIIVQEDGQVVKKTDEGVEVLSEEEAQAKKQEITEKVAEAEAESLQAVPGKGGSGTTSRVYDGNTYYQRLTVEGLTPLQKGFYYEAWLQKDDGIPVSIGRIEVVGSQGELYYSIAEDRTIYNKVLVSYEMEDGNAQIGGTVLTTTP